MQKKMADVHPLITIFGVFIGLSLFGFMGVIFGPLMLAMFVFCVNVFKRRYLDGLPDRELFQPAADRADDRSVSRLFYGKKAAGAFFLKIPRKKVAYS